MTLGHQTSDLMTFNCFQKFKMAPLKPFFFFRSFFLSVSPVVESETKFSLPQFDVYHGTASWEFGEKNLLLFLSSVDPHRPDGGEEKSSIS